MSLMNWLFSTKKRSRSDVAAATGPGAARRGGPKEPALASAQSARRKAERAARRELLYSAVREAMVRAGVLSASYKFKVLSLDGDGRQFLIMIDLARGAGGDASHLAEIEALIAQSAKSRHELVVTAVYWRLNEQAGAGRIGTRSPARSESQPMPLESQPVPLHSAPAPLVATSRGPAYEPIQADEVEAFKKALVAGSTGSMPLTVTPGVARTTVRAAEAGGGRGGPRSYTLLTGYEDTEMPDSDQKSPLLSGTQYGDLH
ncbi:MAG: hypothetical protein JWQ33_3099 [Ramlibacter sp.]|nr:hypothetical protein [Ramlibacter sp.]